MPAPTIAEEILGRCHYYRTACALPCHVDERGRLAITIGGTLRALVLAEYWGYRVQEELAAWRMSGPTIWHPVQRLTILTGPYPIDDYDPAVRDLLRCTDSVLVEPGRPIILPSPGDGVRGWASPIRDLFRPTMATVLTTLAEYAARESR
ncbi:hypothetical protein [Nocardia sp. NPDC051463]|uniref:hypothetical protein n=1 Tax=Nocardia sp. NPDC051463 TaxID=3154845 RepID=UPI00341318B9